MLLRNYQFKSLLSILWCVSLGVELLDLTVIESQIFKDASGCHFYIFASVILYISEQHGEINMIPN